jgi:clan AA aspartic protease (TIGR02281 family)
VSVNRWLTLALGALIGQWLAFGGAESPARAYSAGMDAWDRQDYADAARLWSRAVALQPDNPHFHYMLASALGRLGHRTSAADAYRLALLLEPPHQLAQLAQDGLTRLAAAPAGAQDDRDGVRLELANGVWIVPVTINGGRQARFLLDTGASVTLIAPALAETLGMPPAERHGPDLQLQTVAGLTAGRTVKIPALRVGDVEIADTTAVVHDPGPGVDGILGNSFLGRFLVTIDADRKTLALVPFPSR